MNEQTPITAHESRLSIRASELDKILLAQAARARRMTMSQFVREVSLQAARAIVDEQTEFRLPPEQWEAFCRSLDAPPRAIPALQRLFGEEADPFHG